MKCTSATRIGVRKRGAHHRLLAHYFHSAKQVAPVVRVTLASDQAQRWRCDAAAARAGLELKDVAPFHDDAFPGYTRRRSLSGGSFRARTAEASETRTYAARDVEVAPVAWAAPRRSEQVNCPTCGKPRRDARGLAMHLRDATCAYAPPPRPPSPPPLPADDPAGCASAARRSRSLPRGKSRGLRVDGVQAQADDTHTQAPALQPVAPAGLACAVCARTFKDDRALRQHAATCSRKQRRIKIHYVHGLEAGPKAFKARCLAKVGDVTSPAMATSLWNPFCENAFLGRFLAHFVGRRGAGRAGPVCWYTERRAERAGRRRRVVVGRRRRFEIVGRPRLDGADRAVVPRPPAAPLLSRRRRARDRVPGAAEEDFETRRPGPRHGRRHRAH